MKKYEIDNTSYHSLRKSFRKNLQVKNPKLGEYINVLMAHSSDIGFDLYGEGSADWQVMNEIIDTLNYSDILNVIDFEDYDKVA